MNNYGLFFVLFLFLLGRLMNECKNRYVNADLCVYLYKHSCMFCMYLYTYVCICMFVCMRVCTCVCLFTGLLCVVIKVIMILG